MAPLSRPPLLSLFDAVSASVEAFFSRRENVILFFAGRYFLIIGALVMFWLACRSF